MEPLDLRPRGLLVTDGEGGDVVLEPDEAQALLVTTGQLDDATVSACPGCRSRVLAAVALVDLLDAAPPHPRSVELVELADDAPTLHVYVVDPGTDCGHDHWLDPGFEEWDDVVGDRG